MKETALYTFSSVILIIILLHFINFKVIIKYDNVLLITFKILFFSYSFKPVHEEIDFNNIFSIDGLFSELDDIKDILEFIFSQNKPIHKAYKEFISHLKYKLEYIDVRISTENAAKTVLSYAITVNTLFYILAYLNKAAVLKINNKSKIQALPCFLSEPSYIKFKISSHISIISLISFWLKMGIKMLYQSILSLIKKYRRKYGTKQAKRNDKSST